MTSQRLRSALGTLLKFGLSVGVIAWLISTGRFDFALLKNLWQPQIVVMCAILTGINIILCNERWLQLLHAQGLQTGRWLAMRLTLIGLFFNFVVPGGVGGDVIKGFYIARENPEARLKSVISVAMDRLVGMYTMLLMALLAIVADWDVVIAHRELVVIFVMLAALTVGFSLFWLLIFSKRLSSMPWLHNLIHKLPKGAHLQNMLQTFATYSQHKVLLFKSIGLSFLSQCTAIGLFMYVGRALDFQISAPTYFFVGPVGFMVTAIPISPGGVGVGQAAFYYLFNLISGQVTPVGTIVITALQLFQFLFGLVGALFYITMSRSMKTATAHSA